MTKSDDTQLMAPDQNVVRASTIDFDRVDPQAITQILSTGSIKALTPEERAYYDLMLMVRGFRMKARTPTGHPITKAAIIRYLKEGHGVSDWTARRIYEDAINFFYGVDNVTKEAWANLYAERMDKLGDVALNMGDLKAAGRMYERAAKMRGVYDGVAQGTDGEAAQELAKPTVRIYTTTATDLGLPELNTEELEEIIDSIPEAPDLVRERWREDAGLKKMNFKKRMIHDKKDFGEDTTAATGQ